MLLDELKALAEKINSGCVVGNWVKEQDPEFQQVFEMLQSKPNLNVTETLVLIKKYHPEVPFARTSFSYHMRGTCTCQTA